MHSHLLETLTDPDGWVYDIFQTNTPPGELEPFQAFAQLWHSKRKADALPAWRDYELEDFAPWYGFVIVQDIIFEDPLDMQFRLWGTKVVELFERELTHQRMSNATEHHFNQVEFDLIARFAKDAVIVHSTGNIHWQDRDHVIVHVLELPLADDGKNVDKVIGLFHVP